MNHGFPESPRMRGSKISGLKKDQGLDEGQAVFPARPAERHRGTCSPSSTTSRVRPGGLEPPTLGLEIPCSIRLSYGRIWTCEGPRALTRRRGCGTHTRPNRVYRTVSKVRSLRTTFPRIFKTLSRRQRACGVPVSNSWYALRSWPGPGDPRPGGRANCDDHGTRPPARGKHPACGCDLAARTVGRCGGRARRHAGPRRRRPPRQQRVQHGAAGSSRCLPPGIPGGGSFQSCTAPARSADVVA